MMLEFSEARFQSASLKFLIGVFFGLLARIVQCAIQLLAPIYFLPHEADAYLFSVTVVAQFVGFLTSPTLSVVAPNALRIFMSDGVNVACRYLNRQTVVWLFFSLPLVVVVGIFPGELIRASSHWGLVISPACFVLLPISILGVPALIVQSVNLAWNLTNGRVLFPSAVVFLGSLLCLLVLIFSHTSSLYFVLLQIGVVSLQSAILLVSQRFVSAPLRAKHDSTHAPLYSTAWVYAGTLAMFASALVPLMLLSNSTVGLISAYALASLIALGGVFAVLELTTPLLLRALVVAIHHQQWKSIEQIGVAWVDAFTRLIVVFVLGLIFFRWELASLIFDRATVDTQSYFSFGLVVLGWAAMMLPLNSFAAAAFSAGAYIRTAARYQIATNILFSLMLIGGFYIAGSIGIFYGLALAWLIVAFLVIVPLKLCFPRVSFLTIIWRLCFSVFVCAVMVGVVLCFVGPSSSLMLRSIVLIVSAKAVFANLWFGRQSRHLRMILLSEGE